jgi:hypothetical protein
MKIERGSTRSLSVENSLWKRLWTCRKTDYRMNKEATLQVEDRGIVVRFPAGKGDFPFFSSVKTDCDSLIAFVHWGLFPLWYSGRCVKLPTHLMLATAKFISYVWSLQRLYIHGLLPHFGSCWSQEIHKGASSSICSRVFLRPIYLTSQSNHLH